VTVQPGDPLTRVRAAAGAVIRDEQGRVLLVHPTYQELWELPGGALEPGESPLAACRRELTEEIGFVPPLGELLCVDWVPPRPPWDGGVMFLFDGGVLPPARIAGIRLPRAELDGFGFVAAADLALRLIPRMVRRVVACLARPGPGAVYPEDGVAVAAVSPGAPPHGGRCRAPGAPC
jgi:8-oxo-dGTP pyrophosphatase MutT (NUDIX family)